jgi:hypothetical protein
MIILVDLSKCIANFKMLLVIVHPMFLAAVNGKSAVRAVKVDMSRCLGTALGLGIFVLGGDSRNLGLLVIGVWAVGMLSHEGRSTSELRDGRLGEWVE